MCTAGGPYRLTESPEQRDLLAFTVQGPPRSAVELSNRPLFFELTPRANVVTAANNVIMSIDL
jgi:hypothetical protein